MKKNWLWLVLILALLLGNAILWSFLDSTQTVRGFVMGDAFYQGRPTRYWRVYLREDGYYGALSRMNLQRFSDTHAAFAVLRACASDPDPTVRWPAIALLGRGETQSEEILSVLVNALDDEDVEVRLQAVRALDHWGPIARSAVPALAKLLKDPEIRIAYRVDLALWDIDQPAAVEECGWKPFRSSDWKFTAMVPTEPKQTEQSFIFYDLHWFISMHKFGPHTGDTAYGIGVIEIPAEWLEGKSKEDFLAKARDNVVEKFGGKLIGRQPIEQNGWKGIEYRIEAEREGTPLLMRTRLIWTDNRLYQVYVGGVPQFLNTRAANYFMDSFQLDKPERKGAVPSGSPQQQQNQRRK